MKLALRTLLVAALIVEFLVISRRIPLPVIDFLAVATTPVANGPFTDYRGEMPGKVHFLTGFVTPNGKVWGRPVGVAVAQDGSLLVTDDGSQSLWRVSYVKQ